MIAKLCGLGAATLALTANAFLLPPTIISIDPISVDSLGPLTVTPGPFSAVDPNQQLFKLECPNCPYAVARTRHSIMWAAEPVDNSLMLDFKIGRDEASLFLNNVQVYPPVFNFWPSPLLAAQVHSDVDIKKLRAVGCGTKKVMITEYEWEFLPHFDVSTEGAELIPATFRILAIEGRRVNIPAVDIKLIKGNDGQLMIASINSVSMESADDSELVHTFPAHETADAPNCDINSLLCRLRSMLKSGIKNFRGFIAKGCGKKKAPASKAQVDVLESQPQIDNETEIKPIELPEAQPVPQPERHRHHHHPNSAIRFFHGLARSAEFVLLPMFIGVATGFAVYIIGMAAGLLLSSLWLALRRWKTGGRGTYAFVIHDDNSSDISDEESEILKKEEMAHEQFVDAPPQYENEAGKEVVNEK